MNGNSDRGYRSELVLLINDGTPDPLYNFESSASNTNTLGFTDEGEAENKMAELIAAEDAFTLRDKYGSSMGTISSADTLKVLTFGGEYYVCRAFNSEVTANNFVYGMVIEKSRQNLTVYSRTDDNGTVWFIVGYESRAIWAGESEEKQRADLKRVFGNYMRSTDRVDGSAVDSTSLFLGYVYLSDYNKTELSADALSAVETFFTYCREKGYKSMLRFAYNNWFAVNDNTETGKNMLNAVCANGRTIESHIDQLAPLVAEYKDTIFTVSSGFLGFVGEWADDYQYTVADDITEGAGYTRIMKKIVESFCVPNGLYFTARLPSYKNDFAEKYPALAKYVGHNNDALYGEQTNSGWQSGDYQLGESNGWWEQVTAEAYATPQSGELFVQSAGPYSGEYEGKYLYDLMKPRESALDVIKELAHHRHSSFSNWHGFHEALYNDDSIMHNWRSYEITAAELDGMGIIYDPEWFGLGNANIYDYIGAHLGYRFKAAGYTAERNYDTKTVSVTLDIKNYGFAAGFNLKSYIAICDAAGNIVKKVATDSQPDSWYSLPTDYYTVERTASVLGDVVTHSVSGSIDISDLAAGSYSVGFVIENSAGDTVYLANGNTPNATGCYTLAGFTVK